MINTQYINLNMVPSGVMPVLYCSQYDIGRPLGMVVYNGSEAVDLDTYTCTIEATRTDGTAITAAVTTSDNIGVFTTTATMTNQADKYPVKLVLFDSNSRRVASLAFVMVVTERTMDENAESIEEDAPLYQQYTATIQATIAAVRADLVAEIANRQSAVSAEASARQSADITLQSNINAEASTRAAQDASLQTQINQIIAPSGEAPSAAEVQNARIGADGVTYSTLGDAIRTQNNNIKSVLHLDECVEVKERGYSAIDYPMILNSYNVWTTTGNGTHIVIPVSAGDVVGITAGAQVAIYAVLREYTEPQNLTYPLYSQATGFTTRLTLAAGTSATVTMPADARYLVVTHMNENIDFLPSVLTVNGCNMFAGTDCNLRDLNDEIIAKVGEYSGTFGATATVLHTGIMLTENVPYTIYVDADITTGRINIFNAGDANTISYAYSKGFVYFTPSANAELYLYNINADYSGDITISVYESAHLYAKNKNIPTVYEVGAAKKWKSFTALLYHLKDDDSEKIIYVDGKDYDIFQEYTDLGLLSGDPPVDPTYDYFPYCVWIPKNTHIIGRGRVRLIWQPTTSDISAAWSKTISPINAAGTMTLENVEIHCKNGRYCIHDDTFGRGSYMGAIKKYKNVKCFKYVNDTGYGFVPVIGFGLEGNCRYEFDNCTFEHETSGPAFYMHGRGWSDDYNFSLANSPDVIVNNSAMITQGYGFRFGNVHMDTLQHIQVLFAGCYIGGTGIISDEASTSQGNQPNVFDVTLLRCNNVTVNVVSATNPYPVKVL